MSHSALISPDALSARLSAPNVKVIDATYGQSVLPIGIAGAVNFDIDAVADPAAPLPHTIPDADGFSAAVSALGISNDDLVVVYDQTGIAFAAARVWWMFRLFGHDKVRVLNGGLPAWQAAGYRLSAKQAKITPTSFKATFQPHLFKALQDMLDNITQPDFAVIDARDPARFSGMMPEPRPGMASGHIPGSQSVFFGALIDPATQALRPKDELERIFQATRIPSDRPIACTCGSGVTACVVALALHEIGIHDAAVYDGSWSEWATTPGLPVEKGETAA